MYEGSGGQIQGAIDSLVKPAIKRGCIRKDLEPFDLLRALIGVSNIASSPDWQRSARRLVDILIIVRSEANEDQKVGVAFIVRLLKPA